MTSSSDHLDDLLANPELAEALEQESFKHFLDHLPVAIAVSKQFSENQRIVYANHAFEKLIGIASNQTVGRGWSILDEYCHEEDAGRLLGQAIISGEDYLGCFVPCKANDRTARIDVSTTQVRREGEAETFRRARRCFAARP